MEKILTKLGFDRKEIAIYLTLLEYGPRPASFIAQKTKINRSSIYYLVDDLVARQIILQSERSGIICFAACEPADLIVYLQNQQQRLKSLETEVSERLPELEAMQNHLRPAKPKFSYFNGQKEVRGLLERTLNNKRQKLWAVLSMADIYAQFGEEYFENYVQRRIEKDILLKVVRSDQKDLHPERWQTSDAEMRAVRPLPERLEPPDMSFYLWDERYCAFLSSREENYGLLIESPEFFQTQKMLFDSLWRGAKA